MYGAAKNQIVRTILLAIYAHYRNSYGLEVVLSENVGGGLMFAHPYCITVNSQAKIGCQCTLFKGCTIGSIRGGRVGGVPTIGDRVVICTGAMVCGNILVGNDVLIAANSFVNFDVPSHSVVVGNPGVIHPKHDPCKYYL